MRPFSVEEGVIKDDDVTAKAEFHCLREDNTLKADFQDSDLATFWHKAGTGYPVLSDRALKVLIIFVTTYHCEADFSTMVMINFLLRLSELTRIKQHWNKTKECSLFPHFLFMFPLKTVRGNYGLVGKLKG